VHATLPGDGTVQEREMWPGRWCGRDGDWRARRDVWQSGRVEGAGAFSASGEITP